MNWQTSFSYKFLTTFSGTSKVLIIGMISLCKQIDDATLSIERQLEIIGESHSSFHDEFRKARDLLQQPSEDNPYPLLEQMPQYISKVHDLKLRMVRVTSQMQNIDDRMDRIKSKLCIHEEQEILRQAVELDFDNKTKVEIHSTNSKVVLVKQKAGKKKKRVAKVD